MRVIWRAFLNQYNMDFKNLNDNLISRRWKERYASLSEGVKKKIDALGESTPKEYLLKKSRGIENIQKLAQYLKC